MQALFDSLSEANHGEGLPQHDPETDSGYQGKSVRRRGPFSTPSARQVTAKELPIHDPTFIYTIASWPVDVKRVHCGFTFAFTIVRKEGLIFGSERGIVSTI